MKKYRIVPVRKNEYKIEVSIGIIDDWSPYGVENSLEAAFEKIRFLKGMDEVWEKQRKEQEEFQKQNPPIYP